MSKARDIADSYNLTKQLVFKPSVKPTLDLDFVDQEYSVWKTPSSKAVDSLTNIVDVTRNSEEDGNQYPETSPIDGWYVNIHPSSLTPELEPYIVAVNTPMRVYAGGIMPVYLSFASEQEFKDVTGYADSIL